MVGAGDNATVQTLIYTGRPLRVIKNEYVNGWEARQSEIKELTGKGILPAHDDMEKKKKAGEEMTFEDQLNVVPLLMGQCASAIKEVLPAKVIMEEMVNGAAAILNQTHSYVVTGSRL